MSRQSKLAQEQLRALAATFGQAASIHARMQMREEARQHSSEMMQTDCSSPQTQNGSWPKSGLARSLTPPARRSSCAADEPAVVDERARAGMLSSRVVRSTTPTSSLRGRQPSHPSASHAHLARVQAETAASRARLQIASRVHSEGAAARAANRPRRASPLPSSRHPAPLSNTPSAANRSALSGATSAAEPSLASRLHSLHAARALAARTIQRHVRRMLRRRAAHRRSSAATAIQRGGRLMLARRARRRAGMVSPSPPLAPQGRWAERFSSAGMVVELPHRGVHALSVSPSDEPVHERLHQLHSQRMHQRQAQQELALHTFKPQTNSAGRFAHVQPRTETGLSRSRAVNTASSISPVSGALRANQDLPLPKM